MPTHPLPSAVREAIETLSQLQPMRRGSLSERYIKCSKPNCRCRQDADARHGPYYSWTRAVGGQTRSRLVSAEQASRMRQQIGAGQKFRHQVERLWEACEAWADRDLQVEVAAASAEVAEKKGSARTSASRSGKKSKRS